MGINNEVFKFNRENNRRGNIDAYQASFPLVQALTKDNALETDSDYRDATGNYEGEAEPILYKFNAFTTADSYVTEILVTISAPTNMDTLDYGNISGGLLEGVVIAFYQKGEYVIVSPVIRTNLDYQSLFDGIVRSPGWKHGDRTYTASLQLKTPLILKGGSTDFLAISVHDDFSALERHSFTASGWSTNLKGS